MPKEKVENLTNLKYKDEVLVSEMKTPLEVKSVKVPDVGPITVKLTNHSGNYQLRECRGGIISLQQGEEVIGDDVEVNRLPEE